MRAESSPIVNCAFGDIILHTSPRVSCGSAVLLWTLVAIPLDFKCALTIRLECGDDSAKHLRAQAEPDYLDLITDDPDGDGDAGGFDEGGSSGDDLYDRAVAVVTRDRKASTSYIQRRLQIGYNRAATLMERMEQEGVISPANHAGKREVLAGPPPS